VIIPAAIRSAQRMRHSARRIATLDGMRVLINPRSAAHLAAASAVAVAVSLAPVTVAALTASTALPAAQDRHVLTASGGLAADGLCDGHHWSLFGCRRDPGHHRIEQPDAVRL
jgi:hypothetical protein